MMPQNTQTNPAAEIPKPYDEGFFKRRAAWRSDYKAISKWILKNVEGESFFDFGCGNGYIMASLKAKHKQVRGVDAAAVPDKYIDEKIAGDVSRADLTKQHEFAACDVAICFDVADRIDEKYADILIKNIVSTKASTIVFSASEPGKAGVYHVNLKPKEYWLNKFNKAGYCLDTIATYTFKANLAGEIKNLTWYTEDTLILQKYSDPAVAKCFARAGEVIEKLVDETEELKRKSKKMEVEYWHTAQRLNSILESTRWKSVSKLLRAVGK